MLKGYFDLKHWSEPTHQDGDTSWIPNIWILVPNSGTRPNGNSWETTSVNGPAVVSLLDYTPTPTYNLSDSYDKSNVGYGWVFPIDGKSEPNCASRLRLHHGGHRCHRCNLSAKRYQKRLSWGT